MSGRAQLNGPWLRSAVMLRVVRSLLGVWFVYMGLTKALHPVEFLKAVREYGFFDNHFALNFVAATLPWFEVYCGVLLIGGIAVAGAAAALLALLFAFTAMVIIRAWSVHALQSIPFCAVRFDCGCGTGEVLICRKVLENAVLMALALLVVVTASRAREPAPPRRGAPAVPSANTP